MSAIPGLTCPECGRRAGRERVLAKPRRRWRLAGAGLLIVCLSVGTMAYARGKGGAWRGWLPDTAVILLIPHTHQSEWAAQEMTRRLGAPPPRAARDRRLFRWQWRLLADACVDTIERRGLPSQTAAAILLCEAPAEASFGPLLGLLRNGDPTARYWGASGLVRLRYTLTGDQLGLARDAILDSAARESARGADTRALQAHAMDLELQSR